MLPPGEFLAGLLVRHAKAVVLDGPGGDVPEFSDDLRRDHQGRARRYERGDAVDRRFMKRVRRLNAAQENVGIDEDAHCTSRTRFSRRIALSESGGVCG